MEIDAEAVSLRNRFHDGKAESATFRIDAAGPKEAIRANSRADSM